MVQERWLLDHSSGVHSEQRLDLSPIARVCLRLPVLCDAHSLVYLRGWSCFYHCCLRVCGPVLPVAFVFEVCPPSILFLVLLCTSPFLV